MNKPTLLFSILLVAFATAVFYLNSREDDPSVDANAAAEDTTLHREPERDSVKIPAGQLREEQDPLAATGERSASAREEIEELKAEVGKLRSELEATRVQLESVTRPFGKDVMSSMVQGVMKPGETLVTGGYQTDDGNYELAFLTPRNVTLEDGREAIEIKGRMISVGRDFIEDKGLETLVTNARNTLQHGEIWGQDDVAGTIRAASGGKGSGLLSLPTVITRSSDPYIINLGQENGAQISIEGRMARNPDGTIAIQTRVERTPTVEQTGE